MKVENFTTDYLTGMNDKLHSFSFRGKRNRWASNLTMILLLLFMGFSQKSYAQCPLACNNNVQVSLDDECMALVTPDMVLEGTFNPQCNYTVQLYDLNDNPIANPIDGSWVGQTIKAKVSLGLNSCWGFLLVEDKIDPTLECPDPMIVGCNDLSPMIELLPEADDNCDPNPEVVILSDVTTDLNCFAEYSAVRVITYVAFDASGNESNQCTKTIYYERADLGDVVFPPDYNDAVNELPSLECDGLAWDLDGDLYPDPEETGYPELDGHPFYPNEGYCEMNVTYDDQVIYLCEGSFKVIRKWTVLDWCTGTGPDDDNPIMDFQVIKVLDRQVPIVTCPVDMTVNGDPYTCTADVLMPAPILIYDCSEVTYSIALLFADEQGNPPLNGNYEGDDQILDLDEQLTLYNLPFGRTWVRYTIYDACGNKEYCFIEITVVDEVAPVAVCDEHTVVSLTSANTAKIYAYTFDDGSHDNCGDVHFEVRRMGNNPCGPPYGWGDYVHFCCADVGNTVMVSLRVWDEFDNSNTCMVEVTVQDKIDPEITCPPDITLDCDQDHTDLGLTGTATGTDNCGDPDITYIDSGSIDNCGEGVIYRVWTATDAGDRTASCVQKISRINLDPFDRNDIYFPPNRDLTGCIDLDTDPSETGVPQYDGDDCSLLADTYHDQTFSFVEGACLKILRTWTVIDWCQFDQANPSNGGVWQYTQIIKVSNFNAPVFASQCADITVDGTGSGCTGSVQLEADADDDCTPDDELEWSYVIDVFNDGNSANDLYGSSSSVNRPIAFGYHKITWTVEDKCGNISMCMQNFTVEDTKPPTPYCIGGITTVIMPTSGTITIWAVDFDLGSQDNCPGPLTFGIRPVGTNGTPQSGWTFDCDDVGVHDVEIWVYDNFDNADYCNTKISIQANNGSCGGDGTSLMIAGAVSRESTETVEEVQVTLHGEGQELENYYMTDLDGHYEFHNINPEEEYEVSATRDDDYLNGVSTLDIVLIQKHILGLSTFDSPYKVIAADANNSESVSATDLVALRKLILGLIDELPQNDSWRFVDASQEFDDVENPWPFAEVINIAQLTDSDMDNDFVAIKIGDVNLDAVPSSGFTSSEIRSNNVLTLELADQTIQRNERTKIPVTASEFDNIYGFQMTLNYSTLSIGSIDIEGAKLNLTNDHIALHEGMISMSWNDSKPVSFTNDDVLFYLIVEAKQEGTPSEWFEISSDKTKAEAYDADLHSMGIELNFRTAPLANGFSFELLQNRPNPFTTETTVEFILPEAGPATLTIFDIAGKLIKEYRGEFIKGKNSIQISNDDLGSTHGVLYYQLEADGQRSTRKMILMY